MVIDYLGHSGFLAETGEALLLFDCCRKDLSLLEKRDVRKPLFVFVSHAHGDHFSPAVFSLRGQARPVRYLLSFDLRGNPAVPPDADARYLEADDSYEIPELGRVRCLRSTDEGVAFLVSTPEAVLFHAGDLNDWDWPGEDPRWLREQKALFRREIGTLADERIDAAFAVLDDRLEENSACGISCLLSVCRPRYLLPMHFWEDRTVVGRLKRECASLLAGTVLLDTSEETHWEIETGRNRICSSK